MRLIYLKKLSFRNIMGLWTSQPGFPYVNVTKTGNKLTLKQERFFSDPTEKPEINDAKWTIPIRYRTNTDNLTTTHLNWFKSDTESLEIDLVDPKDWYKLNHNQVGYYRVNYDTETWNKLIEQLKLHSDTMESFTPLDRANLINDAFALADSTLIEYDIPLKMLEYVPMEHHLIPVTVAINQLKRILPLLNTNSEFLKLLLFLRTQFLDVYNETNWSSCTKVDPQNPEEEPCKEEDEQEFLTLMLREKIVDFMCYLEYSECLEESKNRLRLKLVEKTPLNPNVETTVYFYGVGSSVEDWDSVNEIFKTTSDPQERSRLMLALSGATHPSLLGRYLERIWEDAKKDEFLTILRYISENSLGESLVWIYVEQNWSKIIDRYGTGERSLGTLIVNITRRFKSLTQLNQVRRYLRNFMRKCLNLFQICSSRNLLKTQKKQRALELRADRKQ